jgi:hypothetical protein
MSTGSTELEGRRRRRTADDGNQTEVWLLLRLLLWARECRTRR